MNDMNPVIVPKSDQINADDLLSGPMTITINNVKIAGGKEQPVSMFFNGSDKAYRPCKSMCRVIVSAWGADASKYVGRSMTLYCDPKVKWGGMEVGGIRISHMSHIDSAMTMALTVTRANKKPFTVRPLPSGAQESAAAQVDHGSAQAGVTDRRGPNADHQDPAPASAADHVYAKLKEAYDNAPKALKARFDLRMKDYGAIANMPLEKAHVALDWFNKEIDKGAA